MISRSPHRELRALALASVYVTLVVVMSPGRVQASAEAPGRTERSPETAQLEAGIESLGNLDPAQRVRMLQNLKKVLEAGLDPTQLGGLFPVSGLAHLPPDDALAAQATVISAIEAGLPAELIVAKVVEGCRKRVPPPRVLEAADRMKEALSLAAGFLVDATEAGIIATYGRHGMTGNVALNVWGGLGARDLEKLRKKGADRVRAGRPCSLEELVAASDCAAGLLTAGADHDQAVDLAGEALGRGLTSDEMREMATLVAAANQKAPVSDILHAVRDRLDAGLGPQEMARHLVRAGWLGPGDVPGSSGHTGPETGPGRPGYPGGAGDDLGPGGTTRPGGSGGDGTGNGGGGSSR